MSKRITYLLGAGASANSLPTVNQLNVRLSTWQGSLIPDLIAKKGNVAIEGRNGETIGDGLTVIKNDFEWLVKESTNFLTVDTLAKKYYLTDDTESLVKLKAALSLFFTLEQIIQPVDTRYDSFWASILNERLLDFATGSKLNIITWNYDSQLEKSLLKFSPTSDIKHLQSTLQILPMGQRQIDIDPTRFSVIKLNGTAGLHTSNEGIHRLNYWREKSITPQLLDRLIYFYLNYKHQPEFLYPELGFAWETASVFANYSRQQAVRACTDTEILIIIGYSFPFFNRKIDREVLESMKSLQHVYIQIPAEDSAAVKDRFQSFRPDLSKITLIGDKLQFYIPYEY